jgi:hypothetical protein
MYLPQCTQPRQKMKSNCFILETVLIVVILMETFFQKKVQLLGYIAMDDCSGNFGRHLIRVVIILTKCQQI